jgi:glycerol-3-phosphate acyltransferase PlsY
MLYILLTLAFCYLIGSIPTAVWTSRLIFGIDVRTQGSGNAGATNTFRVLGKGAGTFVLLFDIFKGWAGTYLSTILLQNGMIEAENELFLKLVFGFATVLGHVYPVFAQFKGGKGVATLLGMVLCVSPLAALVCVGTFLILFTSLHFVSVGSMVAALVFGILVVIGFCGPANIQTKAMAIFLSSMVVYTHRSNIDKLKAGTENKMYFKKSR